MITPGRHQEQVVEKFIGMPWRFIGDSMGVVKPVLQWDRGHTTTGSDPGAVPTT